MKYLILLLPLLAACETNVSRTETEHKIEGQPVDIIIIDGCEYLYIHAGNASWGTHKGNCKNH